MFKKSVLWAGLLAIAACQSPSSKEENPKMEYPKTAKVAITEDYFGTQVADPYRWLEVSDSSAVRDWITAQNKVTFGYLEQIPYRQQLKERLTTLWNYPKQSAPSIVGKYRIFTKNDGLQNQSVYFIQEGDGEATLLLDPNSLSKEGIVSVGAMSVSKDNKYLAYSLSKGGSDWSEIYVMDIASRQNLSDKLSWVKFSGIAWYKDGFFYSRYDAPAEGKALEAKNEYHKVFYHKIGTPQSEDQLIHEDKQKPLQNFGVSTEEDANLLFLYMPDGTGGSAISYKDLSQAKSEFKPLVSSQAFENSIVACIGKKVYMLTNQKAPKQRLVEIDLDKPAADQWKDIIPESENPLTNVSYVGKRFVATFMKDASHQIFVYDLTGKKLHEVALPTLGTAGGFSGDDDTQETYYTFTSFLYPPTVYRYNIEKNTSEQIFAPTLQFDASQYETKEVFYPSKDGKKVHMFITHKKGLALDGQNPTYLYGYGGFNISINPSFDVRMIPFLEQGGIYAVANLRGGSEYGEEWHEDGMLLKKQNVFDDFIAAAEFLIQEKYTSKQKIAISGRSNGGLLVGACLTQRPDLFAVALPGVGVLDMLRFHKFTIGWAWVNEYGSSENKEQFEYIYRYSPLHNVKEAEYPATLVYTADHDDRVVPAHSFKFISTLQEKQKGSAPTLIRIDVDAGHGAGKPVAKQIDEWVDIWAFTLWNMGVKSLK
jgi:prolyl oligopeptidase